MAKLVFDNAQLIHVYSAQTQDSGRNSKDSSRFRGPVLYSYATPVAVIACESVALVSSVTYSMATSRHIPGARDLAPRRVFHVPYLPDVWGGRYSPPPGGTGAAAVHAANLAHLIAERDGYVAREARRALRGNVVESAWRDDAPDSLAYTGAQYAASLEREAADYAAAFGLAAPAFAPGHGAPEVLAALEAWRVREADPATSRKREASQRQREARAAWLELEAGPILAEAGLSVRYRWDKKDIAAAIKGVPTSAAGLAMLRDRLAARIARHAEQRERDARAAAERAAREARERAEETARAAACGFTLDEWRAMFAAIPAGEHEARERDRRAGAAVWREAWRAGGEVPSHVRYSGVPWDQCEAGADMLRVKPGGAADTLESARRAEVPIAHARRVWPAILARLCSGEEWRGEMRVGHFNITRIHTGGMVAGCHKFSRAELLRVAALLGESTDCGESVA
jgi:hypothetical protein